MVGVGAVAALLVVASMLNDPSGDPIGGPAGTPTVTTSADATASVQETSEPSEGEPKPSPAITDIPGLLAVNRDGELWVRRADGSDLRLLTSELDGGGWPIAWLLDGSRLVIASLDGDNRYAATLSLVDPSTGEVADLGVVFPTYSPMTWSPDGTRLAFGGDGGPGSGIVVLDMRDGGFTQLTHDGGHGYDAVNGPMWSPDGSLIAYQAFDGTSNDVLVVSVEDGTVTSPAPDQTDDYPLRWVSVNGQFKLVFGSFRGTNENKFDARPWIVNVDGSELQLLDGSGIVTSADPQPQRYPSPDGRWVAESCDAGVCISNAGGDLPLYAIPDTRGWTIADIGLSWVPGGDYVVYHVLTPEDRRAVVAILLPNGDPITLTPEGISEAFPAWQPVPEE